MKRILLTAVLASTLALGAGAAPASAIDQLTCAGTESITFSPPLTNTPRTTTVTINNVLAPCLSLTDPTATSGTAKAQVTRENFSCITLLGGGPATRVFRWSNGRSSTFTHNASVQIVGGQLVVTLLGTITEGEFAGSTAAATVTLLADLTKCGTPQGLPGAAGAMTLNVVL